MVTSPIPVLLVFVTELKAEKQKKTQPTVGKMHPIEAGFRVYNI